MAYAADLGSAAARHKGSSPFPCPPHAHRPLRPPGQKVIAYPMLFGLAADGAGVEHVKVLVQKFKAERLEVGYYEAGVLAEPVLHG